MTEEIQVFIIVTVVVILAVLLLAVSAAIKKIEKDEENLSDQIKYISPDPTPAVQFTSIIPETAFQHEPDKYARLALIDNMAKIKGYDWSFCAWGAWWNDIDEEISDCMLSNDIEKLYNKVCELWENVNKNIHIINLHYTTLLAVDHIYKFRDDDKVRDMLYTLCDYDIYNVELLRKRFKEEHNSPLPNMNMPTKKAILLEKNGEIEEAIKLCDYCSEHGILDGTGYGTFEKRKEHLKRKLKK